VLIYCLWVLDLPWSFLSQHDVAANGQGRGDVQAASRQPPVGSRQWWFCVSGVGGNRRGGVAYLSVIKRNDNIVVVVVVPCVTMSHSATWPSSLMGSFMALGLWRAVFVDACCCVPVVALLCVVVIIVRWSWPFVGQLSCWQSFVGQLSSFGSWGCLHWWGLE